MAEARLVLIVGASGAAAATRIAERASAAPGLEAVGRSRRVPDGAPD